MGVSTTHRINLSMWILIYSFSDTYYVWAACGATSHWSCRKANPHSSLLFPGGTKTRHGRVAEIQPRTELHEVLKIIRKWEVFRMNSIIEYGYLQNHISATLLGSYTGPVVHDYGQEPIIFSSSTCATLIILSIVLVWEILSIGHSACLK